MIFKRSLKNTTIYLCTTFVYNVCTTLPRTQHIVCSMLAIQQNTNYKIDAYHHRFYTS